MAADVDGGEYGFRHDGDIELDLTSHSTDKVI